MRLLFKCMVQYCYFMHCITLFISTLLVSTGGHPAIAAAAPSLHMAIREEEEGCRKLPMAALKHGPCLPHLPYCTADAHWFEEHVLVGTLASAASRMCSIQDVQHPACVASSKCSIQQVRHPASAAYSKCCIQQVQHPVSVASSSTGVSGCETFRR